jgi:Integrase zinc binding domain
MATSAIIASINPFPNDTRIAFQSFIQGPGYINRERIDYAKWRQLHIFLDEPNLKPQNQAESRLKHRAYAEFELINKKLYRKADAKFPNPRYVVPESETFDIIANEHLQLLHAGQTKTWAAVQQKYYGIKRQDIEFILKRCKNCALNRPAATKAPLVAIITGRAWERVQIDLIDMRHEPSGQFKWILHIKDHFSKYTQLYPLKSKHAQPIADAFAQFIAAFLPPKIMQADNGKEFKGALLILLRKYGIQIINGAPRSPQTQGLVEQANGVVETKLRAWKMDNGSTEWADGILEVTLAINTQIHSTIGCAPAELLFRERTSYLDWLNSHARRDLGIGVTNEDPAQGPIYTLSPSQLSSSSGGSRIDIGIYTGNSQVTMHISPEASHVDPNLRITPPAHIPAAEEWVDLNTSRQKVVSIHEPTNKLAVPAVSEQQTEQEIEPDTNSTSATSEAGSDQSIERDIEQTIVVQIKDPVIEKAQKSTQKARAQMIRKYSKRNDIQHFKTGDIVSLKIPREDRTSTDNRRLFGRILGEPHPHRYEVLTNSGIIQRLVPTKGLGAVDKALWSDIVIPDSTKEVALSLAAREGSTSARVGISCQCKGSCNTKRCRCFKEDKKCSVHCHRDEHDCGNLSSLVIRTEMALIDRPRRKRARADTMGKIVS